jgi:hypothetical protein
MIIEDGGNIAAHALAEAGRLAKLNIPYLWGGNSERGMDCSGLVQWCMSVGGYPNLPKDRRVWTTATLRMLGTTVANNRAGPGDLIFPDVGHVGIFVSGTTFIDAPETGKTVGIHDFSKYNGGKFTVVRIVAPYGGDSAIGGLVSNIPGLGDVIGGGVAVVTVADQVMSALAGPIAWLSDGANWIRIGMLLGGGALVLFGVVYLEMAS